ncbi:MAG: pitrilysin family protein [Rhodothermia bacterium]|nr:MAG: pitrilysin family protein [Rhodothermia bacterium]
MEASRATSQELASDYGERVQVHELDSGMYIVLTAPVTDVVSFQGSFICVPDFAAGEELVRNLTVSMLDKGTQSRSKIELATELESIGAEINFSTDGVRVRVSGRSLAEDIPKVLSLLAEQLNEPSFSDSELTLLKGRYEAALRRSLSETSTMASGALSRSVYGPDHPFYVHEPLVEIERLAAISITEIETFFGSQMHRTGFSLAIVGETDWKQIESVVNSVFLSDHDDRDSASSQHWSLIPQEPGEEKIIIEDRENIDVKFGHAIEMTPVDDGYIPLYLGNYILGGNFSARLMSVIRDEMGLTYGVHSSLSGMDSMHHGAWSISVTLSRHALEKGIDETVNQARLFVEEGVTDNEIEEKKQTIIGSYKVGLSSTQALASALLRNAEKGRVPSYLDEFPRLVAEITTLGVNNEITAHLDPDRLHVAMAGSFDSE